MRSDFSLSKTIRSAFLLLLAVLILGVLPSWAQVPIGGPVITRILPSPCPIDRNQERQADFFGVHLACDAGFHPRGLLMVMAPLAPTFARFALVPHPDLPAPRRRPLPQPPSARPAYMSNAVMLAIK